MRMAKRYTEKRVVIVPPAQARQLERLSERREVSVPMLIRTVMRQHQGVPTESERLPGLYDAKGMETRSPTRAEMRNGGKVCQGARSLPRVTPSSARARKEGSPAYHDRSVNKCKSD